MLVGDTLYSRRIPNLSCEVIGHYTEEGKNRYKVRYVSGYERWWSKNHLKKYYFKK